MYWVIAASALILANVALQALDVWTTLEALQSGAREQNAVSRFIMESLGLWVWVAIKGLLILALLACGWWLRGGDTASAKRLAAPLGVVAIWMAFVVAGNFQVLAAMG